MISKYPPIEGGVSSYSYWLSKQIGERGHEVHVVTNAMEVESEFSAKLKLNDPYFCTENVSVHSKFPSPTVDANPSHIPFSRMFCEKLASLAIDVIEENDVQVIDSWYLVPYCVSGYLAKSFTNIPQIVRHAGSDLQRLYPSPYLKKLLTKVIQSADKIITNPDQVTFFDNLGIPPSKIISLENIPVDMGAFNPKVKPYDLATKITNKKYHPDTPIIAYIGKITYHYATKGLCELLEACSKIKQDFLLLFVSNGKKISEFKKLVKKSNLTEKTAFMDFVPPWQMPSILKACTCIVSLEKETSPTLSYSVSAIPAEAMATGKCVLMSTKMHKKEQYKEFIDGEEVLVVNPSNVNRIKAILENIIKNPTIADTIGENANRAIRKKDQFNNYVDKIVKLYKEFS